MIITVLWQLKRNIPNKSATEGTLLCVNVARISLFTFLSWENQYFNNLQ
jgi:hypothetical protein